MKGNVDLCGNRGASHQRPQAQGQDGVSDEVADTGKPGIACADDSQRSWYPEMRVFARDYSFVRRIVKGEEDSFKLVSSVHDGPDFGVARE